MVFHGILPRLYFFFLVIGILQVEATRDKRVFSLFNVVQFKNVACSARSNADTVGTCLSSSECSTQGGSSDGNCASVYFETGVTGNAGTLEITTGSGPGIRRYDIKVTYIECLNPTRPPSGCTQYFTGPTGTISSYNHAGGQLLQAQMYTNCIRQELAQKNFPFEVRVSSRVGAQTDLTGFSLDYNQVAC
eukprot:maker-scaffold695_size110128-snap-gene-0.18 protein:Tk05646 transcript:maker-scaffold695_size110128-snap-gene-0.18-mRNA-1 annotation:"hypothetical protein DAPPUDRAFT_313164"